MTEALTLPVKECGARYLRSHMKAPAWYAVAATRLTSRWAKRMGNVLCMKTYIEYEQRPAYRDTAIYVSMEYVCEPPVEVWAS